MDAFSKYTILIPAINVEAKKPVSQETVCLLKTALFAYFGSPKYIITNNVPGFKSKKMNQMRL